MRKKIEMTVSLVEYQLTELSLDEMKLLEKAQELMSKAYAPYSEFYVGASVMLDNGEIFAANNQENVSFPVGTCAERIALGYAMANFPTNRPVKIAIVAKKIGLDRLANVTPCGMCRQAINEYELKFNKPIEILILTPENTVLKAEGVENFLPFRFNNLND
ncbi:cytidine deaminase [Mongoliitalea daihaiensis]|uniref:cytidine deaminase n=1 Tax=Mongoliitalea daihaiensis TaxID=2782006 RepID=UPI001F210B75|nr:cytidine deaminase [Mongoliitalea daihaiensis]UJP65599.1 cytidine deaminase [Mongoliitalea daihaiensis]